MMEQLNFNLQLRYWYIFLDTDDSIRESYKPVENEGFPPLADFFDSEERADEVALLCCGSGSGTQVTQAAFCLSRDYG